ncbi:MAG: polysaccharide biosynthesis/export family protein [Gammaproteobacteria bacterium]
MNNGLRAAMWGVIVASLGIAAPGLAVGADDPSPAAPAATAAGGYGVNPGDILEISVWKEVDLQKQVMVRPDGFFSFPLTGDIRAEGRTVEDVRQDVANRVGRFVPEPVVSVAIMEPRGSKVYVIGQVNRPGEYPVNRFVDIVQAISMAGGFTPFAQLDNIKVLRREGAKQSAIPFSYGDIAAGKRLQQNIVLAPGDTVLVP